MKSIKKSTVKKTGGGEGRHDDADGGANPFWWSDGEDERNTMVFGGVFWWFLGGFGWGLVAAVVVWRSWISSHQNPDPS